LTARISVPPDRLGPAWPWPAFAAGAIVRYPSGMPRADRVSLTAGNLAMPPVDHLSNKGTLNVLLDRTMSGLPAGLPPDRTMVGLFMNFSRLTDKALREYDAARAELLLYVSPPDEILRTSPYLRAIDHMENCVSAAHRAVLNAQALQASKIGRAGPRLTPGKRSAWLTCATRSSTPMKSCRASSSARARRSASPTRTRSGWRTPAWSSALTY
jgi:hypothetical protein